MNDEPHGSRLETDLGETLGTSLGTDLGKKLGEKPSNAALRGFKKSKKNVTFSQKHTTQPKIKVFFLHGKLLRK